MHLTPFNGNTCNRNCSLSECYQYYLMIVLCNCTVFTDFRKIAFVLQKDCHGCWLTCSSRSSTFLCQLSLAAIISSSFCWDSWVSDACLSASYSSVSSSRSSRTSSLYIKQNPRVGKLLDLRLKQLWTNFLKLAQPHSKNSAEVELEQQ